MNSAVLDASAVLALLNGEPGAEVVAALFAAEDIPSMSAVNLAEVVGRLADWGFVESEVIAALVRVPVQVVDFDSALAMASGMLRPATRRAGLSLGDRACLALGAQLGAPVFTTDRSWQALGLPVEVRVIR